MGCSEFNFQSNTCTQVDVGARNVDHILDQVVLPALSRSLLEKMADEQMPKGVTMSVGEDGEFAYTFSQ